MDASLQRPGISNTALDTRKMDAHQLRAAISPYRAPTLDRSLWQIANTFIPFFALWAGMYLSLALSYWIVLLLAPPTAGLVVRIFIIQHDCGHGSYFRSRSGNNTIGRLCSLITFAPYAHWRRQHAGHHGNWNNLDRRQSGMDIYSTCLTLAEYQALTPWVRLRYRLVRHPIVALIIFPPFIFLLLYRIPFDTPRSWKKERWSVWLTNAALFGIFGTLGLTLGFREVLLVQLPISIFATIFGVWLFSLQHRFEQVRWLRGDDWDPVVASFRGSSLLKLPRVLQWFTGNIGFHHIHHLDPRVPNYRLQECYEADPELRTAPVLTLRTGLSALQYALWDEENDRMVRFPSTRARWLDLAWPLKQATNRRL